MSEERWGKKISAVFWRGGAVGCFVAERREKGGGKREGSGAEEGRAGRGQRVDRAIEMRSLGRRGRLLSPPSAVAHTAAAAKVCGHFGSCDSGAANLFAQLALRFLVTDIHLPLKEFQSMAPISSQDESIILTFLISQKYSDTFIQVDM